MRAKQLVAWVGFVIVAVAGTAGVLISCGSNANSGGSGASQAVAACTHVCECVMPGDTTCASGCQTSACGSSSGACTTSSFSFSFSTTTSASVGFSGDPTAEPSCLSCLSSASCDQINAGSACSTVCN